jgi:repressor LexA
MAYDFTDPQARILAYLRAWVADHGEPPSLRQLGRGVGMSSPSSVLYHLRRLEEHGAVRQTDDPRRSWVTC